MKPIVVAVMAAGFVAVTTASAQQAWPTKAVRIVVPQAPGGTTDITARMLAKKYTEAIGQPFVVDNRPGASGMIGVDFVARSPADGYIQLFSSAALSVAVTLYGSNFKSDALKDLAPVIWTSSSPLILALHPSVPAKTPKELVALSLKTKNGLNGGHNGSGTTSHIALEMFRQMTGARMETIGYKGGGPGTLSILAGETDFTFSTLTTVRTHIENGRLRGIAVSTKKRSSVFPNLPTMDSIYPGFESDNWFGLFVPTGTPKDIVAKLNSLAVDALKGPELRDAIAKDGGDVVASTPDELGTHLRSEVARYAKVIKAGHIKGD